MRIKRRQFIRQMDKLARFKQKGLIRVHGVSCHSLAALEASVREPWVNSVHARINPYGTKMDGPSEKVAPVLKRLSDAGKGVVGMKLIGEGVFRDSDEKRNHSVRSVRGLGCVDVLNVGFEKTEEIDDFATRVITADDNCFCPATTLQSRNGTTTNRSRMNIKGSYSIVAPPAQVYENLNDPSILQRSIPGCEKMEKTAEDEYNAHLKLGIGSIKGKYVGKVRLRNKQPPERFTLELEGKGAPGFVKGTAQIEITAEGSASRLDFTATVQVGGLIAAVGSRVVEAAGKKLARDFFDKFSEIMKEKRQP